MSNREKYENKIRDLFDIKSPSKCSTCKHNIDLEYCLQCHRHDLFEEIEFGIILDEGAENEFYKRRNKQGY